MSFVFVRAASIAAVSCLSVLLGGALAQVQPLNASFETPALTSVGRQASPAGATWTFVGTAGIEALATSNNGAGYVDTQMGYLSAAGAGTRGKINQTLTFGAAGIYQLRFMAGRIGAANPLIVSVGGVAIGANISPRALGVAGSPELESWWSEPFTISGPGSYAVQIEVSDNSKSKIANGDVQYIDQVVVAQLPFALPNASFEVAGPSNWTLAGTAGIEAAGAGAAGNNVLRIRSTGSSGSATSDPMAVIAGRYSLSLRIARRESTPAACSLNLVQVDTGAVLAVIPPAESTAFVPYTTSSFDLAAGNLRFQLIDQCSGSEGTSAVDALVFNFAGPSLTNASFAVPALNAPATTTDVPRSNNPAGSSWTYTGVAAGIQRNGGAAVVAEPRTIIGNQFGDVIGNPGSISQSVALTAGTYVVLTRASAGPFTISVNGSAVPGLLRGSVQSVSTSNGYTFGEVMSAPFTLSATANVSVTFNSPGAGFSIQEPRIVRLDRNTPPTASIALQLDGTAAPAVAAPGGTLTVTATASDADGLQRIRALRNGVPLAPESTAVAPASATSPLTVTVSPLNAGDYSFTAEATDHAGGVGTATQTLKVLANATVTNGSFETPVLAAATYSYLPSGADWQFVGSAGIQRNGSAFAAPNAPDGFQTGFLQCAPSAIAGSISQSIAFSTASVFRVSFQLAGRAVYGPQAIQVSLDGVNQGAAISPSSTSFASYSTGDISVAAGLHTLKISATQCDTDRTSFIDAVLVTLVNTPPTFSAFTVTPTATQVSATALTLNATAADPDAAGYVSTIDYQYRVPGAGTYTTISGQSCANTPGSPARPFSCNSKTWTPPAGSGGQYALSALATDNQGATTRSNEITVSVCGPKATLSAPANGATYSVVAGGQSAVTFNAQIGQFSTDAACGTLSKLEFLLDGAVLPDAGATITPTVGVTTYSFTKSLPIRAQPYQLSIRVTEAGVRTAISQPAASVTVIANAPPVVQSVVVGAGGAQVGVATSIAVQISDDASLSSSALTLSSTNTMAGATISCPGGTVQTCTVSWTPPAAGVYTLGLRLTDGGGTSVESFTTVAVSDTPNLPELAAPLTTANIGVVAGQFSVSESGAATYSIPIAAAPGINGIQPNLAFTYNSQGGDGNLGVGWNIAGTSSITRCPKTIATDGVRESVNYDNVTDPVTGNDAFCLDGQRLIPVSSTLSQVDCPAIPGVTPNAKCRAWEFRTELDSYSRIIGIGDNVNPNIPGSGSGPTRFRVYTKSGQILEFGSRWWGMGAPRPDPQTSLITNPSFEDTPLLDSCWAWGDSWQSNFDWRCQQVIFPNGGGTWTGYNDPTWTGGAGSHPEWGYFKTWNTGASTAGWLFGVNYNTGNSGVQRNYSAMSLYGPITTDQDQSVFLQQLGWASTVAQLDAGTYRLGVKLAGRPGGATWGGDQSIAVYVDQNLVGVLSTTTGQPFTQYYVNFTIGGSGIAAHQIRFEGQRWDDQTALLDAITLVPINEDIYSIKVFPLDRVEDRNGNYMHIDYGGTHENQVLVYPDGSTKSVLGTILSSYGNATLPDLLPAVGAARVALIAQGARPALEMYPRRFTYGMRKPNGNNGNNQGSVGGVEIARVILNYECADGSAIWAPNARPPGSVDGGEYCRKAGGVTKTYDTGAAQMLRSRRLASVMTFVGGSDDSSTTTDRDRFHSNETTLDSAAGVQCRTGTETECGQLLRKYTLRYEASSSTQRIRIAGITECAGDGACLPETTFGWQDSGLTLQSGALGAGTSNFNDLSYYGQVADVVGDGRSRLVVYRSGTTLDVCEMPSAGGTASCTTRFMPAGYTLPDAKTANDHAWTLADIDGDGIADLLVTPKSSNGSRAFACKIPTNSNTLLADSNTYQCADLPPQQGTRGGTNSPDTRYYSKIGDFNGDGRIDVAFYRGNGTFEVCLAPFAAANCTLAKLNGLNIAFANPQTELSHQIVADFNGDGRADIAYRVSRFCVEQARDYYNQATNQCGVEPTDVDAYWSVCFATGADNAMSFQCATRSAANLLGAVKTVSGKIKDIANFDFNGDGLADFATAVTVNGNVTGWRVCLSTGDGEFARTPNGGSDCPIWTGPTGGVDKTVSGDFNGDGRTDLAVFKNGTNGQTGTWEVCLSNGSGFQFPCSQVAGPPKPADCGGGCNEVFAGDFNGDGKTDLAVNGYGMSGTLYFGTPDSVMPDLLATVTTGLGAQTRIAYQPLSSTATLRTITDAGGTRAERIYSKSRPGSITDYPDHAFDEIIIQSPMYVVESTRASTGVSNTDWFKTEYRYAQLMANKVGRGLYGFRGRSVAENIVTNATGTTRDDSNAIVSGYLAKNAWPNVGRPTRIAKSGATSVVDAYGNRIMQALSLVDLTYDARSRSSQIALTGGVTARNPLTNAQSSTYTIYEAFQVKSTQNPYLTDTDLDGISKAPRVTTFTGVDSSTGAVNLSAFYDSFGNPLQVVTRTEHPTTTEVWTQTVTNNYYDNGGDTTRWLLGKLKSASTTSTVTGYTTNGSTSVPRKSAFTYHGYDGSSCTGAVYGQLCTETVEPDAATAGDRTLYRQTAYEYDDFGNRTKSTVSFFEDALGATSKSRASTTTYQFGKYPLVTTRLGDGVTTADLSETRAYDTVAKNRCRLATKVTDANGNYATTDYDGFCRKVRESAWTKGDKLAKQTTFTLTAVNGNGEVYALETRSADILHPDKRTSIQYYDNLQRVVRAQARRFDGDPAQTTNVALFATAQTYFDALGRQRCVAKEVSGSTQAAAQPCAGQTWTITAGSAVTRFDYDALNRVVTETAPDGAVISTAYNGLSTSVSRTNPGGTAGANNSSAAHLVTKTANAKGLVATVVTAPIATTVSNTYDAIGNLTSVSTVGGPNSVALVKTMAYDTRGRQTRLSDPDAGNYSYGYNGVGEQVSQVDGAFTTTTTYDNFGRKQTRTEVGGGTTNWTYDCTNAKGLLCSVLYTGAGGSASGSTQKATGYDTYARPITTTTQIDGKSFVSQVAYDAYSRPRYAVYPQATPAAAPLVTRTSYGTLGFAYKVDNPSNGYVYQEIKARNADGQLAQANLGGLITLNQGYASDGLARISRINVSSGTAVAMPANTSYGLLDQTFGFESIGNLKSRSLNGSGRTESEAFGYDALDRLISSTGVNDSDTGSFGYDDAGNITNKGGLTLAYGAGGYSANGASGGNRLCAIGANTCAAPNGPGAINYDSRGNILSYTRPTGGVSGADGATITLSGYTAFNLPTLIQKTGTASNASASFAYDAGYQRIRQVKYGASGTQVDDILYVVPGGFEVHRNGSGQVLQSIATISGADGVIATVTTYFDPNTGLPVVGSGQGGSTADLSGSTTVTRLLIKDHLGSMVAEVVVVGTPGAPTLAGSVQIHGFGPWGNARNLAARFAEGDRGFTGHEHLADLGLIHMNGRLYDPVLGRFLQADPIIQAPHNAQSHNRYVYVMNNPLSFSDPSGFSFWTQYRGMIFGLATAWFLGPGSFSFFGAGGVFGSGGLGLLSGTAASFTSAVAAGFAAGGIQGGNIQSALKGALSAALFFGVGEMFQGVPGADKFGTLANAGKIAAHAAVGCATAVAAGGSCGRGAASAGFAEAAGSTSLMPKDFVGGLIGRAIVGGIASKLGGGKFENGAMTAAFGYLFNYAAHVHTGLTVEAARQAGLDRDQQVKLGHEVADVDLWEGSQRPDKAYMHAMCSEGQAMSACEAATERYKNTLWAAKSVQGLAGLLHLEQDAFAPGHAGGQVWKGVFGQGFVNLVVHVWGDFFTGRNWDTIVEQNRKLIATYDERCSGCIKGMR